MKRRPPPGVSSVFERGEPVHTEHLHTGPVHTETAPDCSKRASQGALSGRYRGGEADAGTVASSGGRRGHDGLAGLR